MKLNASGDGWSISVDTDALSVDLSRGSVTREDIHEQALQEGSETFDAPGWCSVNLVEHCTEHDPMMATDLAHLTGGGKDKICQDCKVALLEAGDADG